MSRKTAREHSFRILFSSLFQKLSKEELIHRYFAESGNEPLTEENDLLFLNQILDGVAAHKSEIDELLEGALQGWKINRLSYVDLTILRISVLEMAFGLNVPVSVSINEAVELAKKYSLDPAPSFINGVLGAVASKVRPEEAALTNRSKANTQAADGNE